MKSSEYNINNTFWDGFYIKKEKHFTGQNAQKDQVLSFWKFNLLRK